jgi:hypothetical protein
MEHITVKSSNLKSVAYDADSNTMEVAFKKGGTYTYPNVTQEQYNNLMNARSKGQYFAKAFRNKPNTKGR